MKVKNVKVGVRVELKHDEDALKAGQRGVILEGDSNVPYVYWFDWNKGHNSLREVVNKLELPPSDGAVWAIPVQNLRKVKGE